MPSKSPAQARLMAAVAHNPQFAKKVGVPQSVGREFNQADKGTGIMSKGSGPQEASYATGGLVLGRTKDFMKEPDRFREEKGRVDNFGKADNDDDDGEGKNPAPPARANKSLPPVKPRRS